MSTIPYSTMEEADTRSREWWAAILGHEKDPRDVTEFVYRRAEVEGVPSIVISQRDGWLDALIAGNEMAFNEVMPCAPLYPAWAAGVAYAAGDICTYDGSMYCVRQAHTSQVDWPPPLVPALFQVWREGADTLLAWIAGEWVEVGWQRTYDGDTYECIQAHTTQVDWTPDTAITLWSLLTPPVDEWTVGVSYLAGDHVMYLGNEYICLQAHTSILTWNPVATLNVLWRLA